MQLTLETWGSGFALQTEPFSRIHCSAPRMPFQHLQVPFCARKLNRSGGNQCCAPMFIAVAALEECPRPVGRHGEPPQAHFSRLRCPHSAAELPKQRMLCLRAKSPEQLASASAGNEFQLRQADEEYPTTGSLQDSPEWIPFESSLVCMGLAQGSLTRERTLIALARLRHYSIVTFFRGCHGWRLTRGRAA
jgi:hypothetical protein